MGIEVHTFARERQALNELLASPEISRSPNLTKILTYLCDKYFAGESGEVKEYHIALEALGRPAGFDQKKDSIVRVEMHRLRRRLKEYYEGPGSSCIVQIQIPEKSYVPVFAGVPGSMDSDQPAVNSSADVLLAADPSKLSRKWGLAALVVLALLVATLLYRRIDTTAVASSAKPETQAPPAASPSNATSPAPSGDEIRILAGRPAGLYVDRTGQTWDGDRFYTGGQGVQVQQTVMTGGFDRNAFLGMRVGDHSYHIPLKPGVYQVELLFAETEYGDGNPLEGGELSRPFRILVNGKVALDNIDILAETSDPNIATSRILTDVSPAADGKLHLEFQAISTGQPFVNAIIIKPGIPSKVLPFRMVCRPQRYRDAKGRVWEPDRYYRGGSTIMRPTTPPVSDGELYRGERYGRFSYAIPVKEGAKYQVTLHFWESWHGPGRPGLGGVGSRIFSVFCNMTPLIRHYDLVADSGPDQVKVKTFHNLEPDRDAKLVFRFDADVNKALLNAIEIVDESLAQ